MDRISALLVITAITALTSCGEMHSNEPNVQASAAAMEAESQKRFGISVHALSVLVYSSTLVTHEQTLRLGDLGKGLKELEQAGYITIRATKEPRQPIAGSGEAIIIKPTDKGRTVHDAFAP